MIYSLLVLSSPASGNTTRSAAQFAHALLRRGHRIERVFFMDEACHTGSVSLISPQDEQDPTGLWVDLAEIEGVELILCISSAIKRGLLDATETERYDKPSATIHPAFTLSGLGQLVDAAARSDRLITFGG